MEVQFVILSDRQVKRNMIFNPAYLCCKFQIEVQKISKIEKLKHGQWLAFLLEVSLDEKHFKSKRLDLNFIL